MLLVMVPTAILVTNTAKLMARKIRTRMDMAQYWFRCPLSAWPAVHFGRPSYHRYMHTHGSTLCSIIAFLLILYGSARDFLPEPQA